MAGGDSARGVLRAARRRRTRLAELGTRTLAGRPRRPDLPALPVAAQGAPARARSRRHRRDDAPRLAGTPICGTPSRGPDETPPHTSIARIGTNGDAIEANWL